MCNEFWRHERMMAEEEKAEKRAKDAIEKAKVTRPRTPLAPAPSAEVEIRETVPA